MVSANIIFFSPDPVLVSPSITVPESVGDAEVCVRLENSVERPFTIFYRTSDNTAQSTLIAFFSLTTRLCMSLSLHLNF